MISLDRRRLIFSIGGLCLAILIALLLWLLLKKPAPPETPPRVIPPVEDRTTPTVTPTTPIVSPEETGVRAATRAFATRYGSVSRTGAAIWLTDLKAMVTPDLYRQLVATFPLTANQEGISSRIVTLTIDTQTETAAHATLSLQREVLLTGESAARLEYVDLSVDLIKTGEVWLVSQAAWVAR